MPPAQNMYEYDPMGHHLVEGEEDELELCELRNCRMLRRTWAGG